MTSFEGMNEYKFTN